ncbi:MAG TPA: glycosyltransferase family 39 protein, partial [Anaerolineales bacterium]|nr:glycosyltransferase family 39 protein [Anaerolineales bacterium]
MRRWTPLLLVCFNIGVYLALRVAAPPTLTGGDPARLGIQAWDFLERQVWPFYIQHLFAPNPLIVYLHAAAFAVFGVTLDALNGVTIAAGILASVAAYRAGCALFHDEGPIVGHRAGLIAALSFPLISVLTTFAGGGTEHILLPLFALTVTAALWHGLRTGRTVSFVLAGVLLGVSQYAYIVARALPVA